jgi:hypothetical protein
LLKYDTTTLLPQLMLLLSSNVGVAAKLRISAMVISRFGERDQYGSWCCAVREL